MRYREKDRGSNAGRNCNTLSKKFHRVFIDESKSLLLPVQSSFGKNKLIDIDENKENSALDPGGFHLLVIRDF